MSRISWKGEQNLTNHKYSQNPVLISGYDKIKSVKHNTDWERKFEFEIRAAEGAREEGIEGRARVCARRAAGVVIIEYLTRKGVKLPRASALNALRYLSSAVEEDKTVRQIAEHFIWHITPEHTLPDNIDLLEEARWLAAKLLGDARSSS